MSQAKVDHYKEEKKNRKKTMAKEKRLHLLAVVCGAYLNRQYKQQAQTKEQR